MILASNRTAMNSAHLEACDMLEGRVLPKSWDKPVPKMPLTTDCAIFAEKPDQLDQTWG